MRKSTLSPIVLFVYNRPWHTEQTLEALAKNHLADQSHLFIYADGLKENVSEEEERKHAQVKELIQGRQWCKEVTVVEREENWGLADNIVDGVTKVVNKYGRVIVLEDDIVTSRGFLQYMNDALELYKDEEQVMHISGYMFPVDKELPPTFFYNTASCWGWGTWQRSWKHYNKDSKYLAGEIRRRDMINAFDIEGVYPFYRSLLDNIEGRLKTWAVRWYASFFLRNGYALHPYPSLTNNIGNDNSGENSNTTSMFEWKKLANHIVVDNISITSSRKARKAMRRYYQIHRGMKKNKNAKTILLQYLPHPVRHHIRKVTNSRYRDEYNENKRLLQLPRYKPTSTQLLGKEIEIADAASFLFMKKEIFKQEIYKFNSETSSPYILDCGSNIGLSIIYFKTLFPKSEIIGFEPDSSIYKLLEHNLKIFNLDDVVIEKQAVWSSETTVDFYNEGADGGRLAEEVNTALRENVKTVRLRKYLQRKVDFLKIDIEGAEVEVIEDCRDYLCNVNNIFIEYHSFVKSPQSLSLILNTLETNGFRYYVNAPGLHSKQPFVKIKESLGMDMQINIYGIRR